MKKIISILCLFLLMAFVPVEPKQLTVSLTVEQWDNVLQVISKSNAPHLQVIAATEAILVPLQKQLADTTKKK